MGFQSLDLTKKTTRNVRRNEPLYRAGDSFNSIYTVRVGSFKTMAVRSDGTYYLTNFYYRGCTLGLEAIDSGTQPSSAIAMEDSTVGVVSFIDLEAACRGSSVVQRHFNQVMSAELLDRSRIMMMLGTMSAEQRVAAFLYNLCVRLQVGSHCEAEVALKMTREEIANHLGIRVETVSRMFMKLQREHVIKVSGKRLHVLDLRRLALS